MSEPFVGHYKLTPNEEIGYKRLLAAIFAVIRETQPTMIIRPHQKQKRRRRKQNE
jgi:hypothetical protein